MKEFRRLVEADDALAAEHLYTIIYYQGVTGLRIGENENCILCRGESSCILPISPAAVHTNPAGSRLAVEHFTEYLRQFPDDLEVRWLLNLAHMTLGEHPRRGRSRVTCSRWTASRSPNSTSASSATSATSSGVNRLNQAGGAIMEDFDNDGLLDLVVTSWDPTQAMALYRNKGDGTFEDRTEAAGLAGQLGGLYCVQADYNNDGHMDIFVCRGAWLQAARCRPSLLRNNGDGTFTDVTEKAGLMAPVNSISAAWADYDNDGLLDLFVCCETSPTSCTATRATAPSRRSPSAPACGATGQICKGAAWIDFDNDGYPDLFLNYLDGPAQLFRNNRDGTFTDVTREMGIDGPAHGLLVLGLRLRQRRLAGHLRHQLRPHPGRRRQGDSRPAPRPADGPALPQPGGQAVRGRDEGGRPGRGLRHDGQQLRATSTTTATWTSTSAPATRASTLLVPNRMFKNVGGKRFAEITGSSRTGHLQKGHGVACGDWDRDGHIDLFVEMGGAINGDRYHNVLFRNPGQGNNWLTVKLVGKKTNRAAIGARIKVVTDAAKPLTVYRHVSSGSSFGANPLQQTIGLAKAGRVATLEVYWPTSGTTQVFRDVAVDQAIEITEFAKEYRKLDWKPIPVPK